MYRRRRSSVLGWVGTVGLAVAALAAPANAQGPPSILWQENARSLVRGLAFWPDGSHVASAGANGDLRVWRSSDGELIRTIHAHGHEAYAIAVSPGGTILASGGSDALVKLWRTGTGELIRVIDARLGGVNSVSFAPDLGGDILVAAGTATGKAGLWRVVDGGLVHTLSGHTAGVNAVAFSPDGQLLATGSADQTVRLWRVSDGSTVRTLAGHTSAVYSLAFSPDGTLLASASGDRTVRLWRVSDGSPAHTFRGHTDTINAVAFSPNGKIVGSASSDGTMALWRVTDGAFLELYTAPLCGRVQSLQFPRRGQVFAYGCHSGTIAMARNVCPCRPVCGTRAQLSTVCRRSGKKVVARLKKAEPAAEITFTVDSQKRLEAITDVKGNAKVTFERLAPGSHVVNVCELDAGC